MQVGGVGMTHVVHALKEVGWVESCVFLSPQSGVCLQMA